jgi:hypothetical protein
MESMKPASLFIKLAALPSSRVTSGKAHTHTHIHTRMLGSGTGGIRDNRQVDRLTCCLNGVINDCTTN